MVPTAAAVRYHLCQRHRPERLRRQRRAQRVLAAAAPRVDDDLYASPALVLLHHHDALANPSAAGVTTTQALKNLVGTCIDLFALGYSEESILGEVTQQGGESLHSERMQSVTDCLALVFITLSCLPAETVTRWSMGQQLVSERSLSRWRGFCSLIVNAYMQHGYAWFSVAKLQVEQSLALGAAEPAPVVAERMSLVYQTLYTAAPRFPSRFD